MPGEKQGTEPLHRRANRMCTGIASRGLSGR
jgi:hypothetical protein